MLITKYRTVLFLILMRQKEIAGGKDCKSQAKLDNLHCRKENKSCE